MAGSGSSKPGVVRAPASSISVVSELSSLFARKSKSKSKPKFRSMTTVVAGKLRFLFLRFLLSLFGKGAMAKMLLSGVEHPRRAAERQRLRRRVAVGHGHADIRRFGAGANLVAAACRKTTPPIRHTAQKKRRAGIAPVAPQLFARWSRAESAPMPGRKLRA
jgi:hypothetical protein